MGTGNLKTVENDDPVEDSADFIVAGNHNPGQQRPALAHGFERTFLSR